MSPIELRACNSWEDCLQCEHVQQEVWFTPDQRDVVPAHMLITAVKNGGLLIGAFQNGRMLGFVFGLLGIEGTGHTRRLKHASHLLAVLPEARGRGLGAALKWAQRNAALGQGLELMTWTFDPLQAVNASLNLARLGAIARRYIVNAYGEMTDALNAGIASDRLEVEWFLTSERVEQREKGVSADELCGGCRIFDLAWNDDLPIILGENEWASEPLLAQIPADIGEVKRVDLGLAHDWRERLRNVLTRAFQSGLVASDFVWWKDEQGRQIPSYVLTSRVPGLSVSI